MLTQPVEPNENCKQDGQADRYDLQRAVLRQDAY